MKKKRLVGLKIKEARENVAKISREQLADRLGVGENYIYQVELGRGGFSLDTLEKFANALGVEIKYFLDWDINKNDNHKLKISDSFETYGQNSGVDDIMKLKEGNPNMWNVLANIAKEVRKGDPDDNKIIEQIFQIPRADIRQKIINYLLKTGG